MNDDGCIHPSKPTSSRYNFIRGRVVRMEERDHGANKREREEDDTTVEAPEKKALDLKEASGKKIFPNPAKKTFPRVPSSATTPSTGGGSIAIPTPESINTSKKVKEVIPHPAVMKDADFYKFGDQSKTDKIFHHAYHRFYPRFIEHYRKLPDKGMAMLEIGLESMKSIPLWTNYFPKAFIYGIDIGFSEIGDRYRIFQADQSDRSKLEDIVKNKINKAIFLIVDDGSHVPEHQVLSFDYLFEHLLLPGGTYIVEDIETSYWRKNGLYGYEVSEFITIHFTFYNFILKVKVHHIDWNLLIFTLRPGMVIGILTQPSKYLKIS